MLKTLNIDTKFSTIIDKLDLHQPHTFYEMLLA